MATHVQWQDIFAVVDDGHVTIAEYQQLEPLVAKQARSCPNGVGCLVILPESATPPPARVRQHLKEMLSRLPVRGLAYLVEGTGFRAAAVRATLIGLGIIQNDEYTTKVATSLHEALNWLLPAPRTKADIAVLARVVTEARAANREVKIYDSSMSRRSAK